MYPLLTNVTAQFVDDNGRPLAGGKVWTYESGTTTPKYTFSDASGNAVNTNPIILDEAGRANIYLDSGAYRVRVFSIDDVLVADTDKLSRYVTSTDLDEFIQQVQDGLDELNQVKESLNTIVEQEIQSQKGVAGGLVPLNDSDKIDPLYITKSDDLDKDDTNILATSKAVKTLEDKKIEKEDLAAGAAPIFAVRGYGSFTGDGTKIGTGGNFKAATRISTGLFEVELENPMPDTNYRIFPSCTRNGGGDARSANIDDSAQTTTKFRVVCAYGGDNTQGFYNPSRIDFFVI